MTLSPDPATGTGAGLSLKQWSATSGSERSSRANLVLEGGGHRWRANADGNGAIDALTRVDNALDPVLGSGVQLVAYDVHATGIGHAGEGVDHRRRAAPRCGKRADLSWSRGRRERAGGERRGRRWTR